MGIIKSRMSMQGAKTIIRNIMPTFLRGNYPSRNENLKKFPSNFDLARDKTNASDLPSATSKVKSTKYLTEHEYDASFSKFFFMHQPIIDSRVLQLFNAVDNDGSGEIDAQELQMSLVNTDFKKFSKAACQKMINMYDEDFSGGINIYEFQKPFNCIIEWKRRFDSLDRNNSGCLIP